MWKAHFLTAFLCAFCYAGEAPHSAHDSSAAWFTQIGTWHHQISDTATRDAHVFHNAAADGAQSGRAFADLKYNRKISGLKHISADFSIGRSSAAGLLLKSRIVTYCFYIENGPGGDSIRITRRFDKQQTTIAAFAATAADTQRLEINVRTDTLRVKVGTCTGSLRRPADLPDTLTIGLTCSRGEVRVWKLRAEATSESIDESFDHATVINLGLEKMFKVRSTHAGHTRPTSPHSSHYKSSQTAR